MSTIRRLSQNPILTPDETLHWQALATFNGCPVQSGLTTHLIFRATTTPQVYFTQKMELSQIGHAVSLDGINFKNPQLLITPEYHWEQYGCEDPRVTKLGDKYYIFYTALADYPHTANGIKIGVAITKDLRRLISKQQVTHFNSKAMALFPEKINGQMVSLLTVNTDQPPAKIALAAFKKEADIWSEAYWHEWLNHLDDHVLPLSRSDQDQVELGAPPVKTKAGWLVIYSYIRHYRTGQPLFGIEAVLLDLKDPRQIIGQTKEPLMIPEQEYELYGRVPKVIFPSGALKIKDKLRLFYGAADTTCCAAEIKLEELVDYLKYGHLTPISFHQTEKIKLEKYEGNPIIQPLSHHRWENKYTFNTGAIWLNNQVHLLYRAMGDSETSVLGYASSQDGYRVDKRLEKPIYQPRKDFEKKSKPGFSGCEDPRLTLLGNKIYMCYTAFDGTSPTLAILTNIKKNDFIAKKWHWAKPVTISCPKRSDKNACLLPAKINGHYAFFHRIGGCIWIDYVNKLTFKNDDWVGGQMIAWPQPGHWDSEKVGIAAPPLATKDGWLLIYHGLSDQDQNYRLGALLLDRNKPHKVLSKLPYPILEATEKYECQGLRPNTVFSCGAVIIKEKLFVYYGAADQYVAVASTKLKPLLTALKNFQTPVL